MSTDKDKPVAGKTSDKNGQETATAEMAQSAPQSPPSEAEAGGEMRLKFFPVAFFAVIMGLSGLTLAWRKFAEAFHTTGLFSHLLGIATLLLFAGMLTAYLMKLVRYPQMVKGELNHPVMSSFVPAISISLFLLGLCMLPIMPALANVLWGAGAILHIILTFHIVRNWVEKQHFQPAHLNPAWFIPAVGNVVAPLAGVPLGYYELSWYFFAVGISFWIILLVIVFNRILFHDPLPPRLLPTLFILIAPPAVGFLSWVKLNGGEVDAFARVLYYLALFFAALMVLELPRFLKLPFFLSWWAYSFPSAAVTVATFVMAEKVGGAFFHWLSLIMLAALTALIVLLIYRTLLAMRAKKICVPPDH